MTAAKPTGHAIYRPWLHSYAVLVLAAMFSLIGIGGNVTSIDAGLAVPHGWTTGGYVSVFAPPSTWWANAQVRSEHIHRLAGSLVGLLTLILAFWLWFSQRSRTWLRFGGWVLLGMVIFQGVMGAARVDLQSTPVALIHGVFGQLVLGATVLICAATSRVWIRLAPRPPQALAPASGLRLFALAFIFLLLGQLVLGAGVRHQKATLAIPDFPRHYGHWIPPLTAAQLDEAYRELASSQLPVLPVTVHQVAIHFAHRVGAAVTVLAGFALIITVIAKLPARPEVIAPVFALVAMLFLQIMLGASVIWTHGLPNVATAHQVGGAVLLSVAVWLSIRIHLVTSRTQRRRRSDRLPLPNMQGQVA